MADTNFNTGPNAMPGGSPEDPRVNASAVSAEIRQAQLLQQQTIKSLTETIDELKKQYSEFVGNDRKLSESEVKVSIELQSKIKSLTEILNSIQASIASGEPVRSLAAIGVKERVETFDKLSNVIKQYQKTNLEFMKKSDGKELDFDRWFDEFVKVEKNNIKELEATQTNNFLLEDIKKVLKKSSSELANLSDEELTEIAKQSLKLSIDQKTRDLEFLQQNRDVLRLNKQARVEERDNVKKLISATSFDPSKPILEYGFKTVSRDMAVLIKQTKARSLLQIISDLMGPVGPIIVGFIKLVIVPIALVLGVLTGLVMAQAWKLRKLAAALSFQPIIDFYNALRAAKIHTQIFHMRMTRLVREKFPQIINALESALGFFQQKLFNFKLRLGYFDFTAPGKFSFMSTEAILANQKTFLRSLRIPEITGKIGRALNYVAEMFQSILNSRFIKVLGTLYDGSSRLGKSITSGLNFVGNALHARLAPYLHFLHSGKGITVQTVDYFTFGILKFFRLGVKIGKILGDAMGPVLSVISVLSDIPKLWNKLWSGDARTAIKGILTFFTHAILEVLIFIFTDGLGNIASGLVLNFDKIYKWFEPLFDIIIDVGEVIWDTISSLFTDFVEPTLGAIANILTAVVDVLFAVLRPVIFALRVIWKIISVTLFPLIKGVFWILGWLFKKIGEGLMIIYDYTIKPVVDVIQKFFDYLYEKFESFLRFFGLAPEKPKTLTEKAKEKIHKAEEYGLKKGKEVLEFGEDVGDKISKGIKDGMDSDFIQNAKGKVEQGVKTAIDDMNELFNNKITPLIGSIENKLENYRDILLSIASGLNSKLLSATDESARRNLFDKLQPAIASATTPSLKPTTPRIITKDEYGDMIESAMKKTGSAVTPVTNVVNNNYYGSGGGGGGGGGTQVVPVPQSSTNSDPTVNRLQQ